VPIAGTVAITMAISPLNNAIYPSEESRRAQHGATGCPVFQSKDSVLVRPSGDPASKATVCPGEHSIGSAADAHTVVWWSPEPQALSLGAQAPFGLRRDDLIVKDVAPDILRARLDTYETWKSIRSADVEAASRASLDVMTATDAATGVDLEQAYQVPVTTTTSIAGEGGRPGGVRFGSLVHALLADVPLGPAGEIALARLAEAHGRILGAEPEEVAAARDAVAATLAHPVLVAARLAESERQCFRETAVTLRLQSGAIIEGYVDLAFRDADGFVVVDFKTDRELEGALERYQRQVQLYAAAIWRSTGLPTRAVLMRV